MKTSQLNSGTVRDSRVRARVCGEQRVDEAADVVPLVVRRGRKDEIAPPIHSPAADADAALPVYRGRPKGLGGTRRVHHAASAAPAHAAVVLRVDSIVFCGRCEAASARTERGWRAYVFTG